MPFVQSTETNEGMVNNEDVCKDTAGVQTDQYPTACCNPITLIAGSASCGAKVYDDDGCMYQWL
jgi:hypothetical protein